MKKVAVWAAVLSAILLTACNNGSGSEASSSSVNESSGSAESSSSVSETSAVVERNADFYAEIALNAVEFPKMKKVEAADEIDAFFEFNTENYADFALYMNVMSVQLNRVLIIKPLPEKHDEVYAELDAYLDDLVRTGAYYPAQEAAAVGAQMSETIDGYIYVIVHENSTPIVQAIENASGRWAGL